MLVLTRRISERIVIGTGPGTITLTVLRIDRKVVRIGISAPKDVPVHRLEVHQQIYGAPAPLVPEAGAS